MKIKFILLLTASLFLQCKVDSQSWGTIKGEGDIVTKQIQLDPMHGVGLGISGELILTQGSVQQVTIEGQQNIIDNIKREVRDGFWSIEYIKNVREAKDVRIRITVPNLDEIGLSGSGSITSTNQFSGLDKLEMDISGSGGIQFDMEAKSTELNLSGSGKADLKGTTGKFEINISGSGNVMADDLKSSGCEVAISGSGDASVQVNGDLEAAISGSGDVVYS
ncbi:MAG TPA: head GIN domain-containing protein, partial [Saprospiraceae bacterium]|nr:head GIN domain-containing protein [Saprospiraceae bacterium]